MRGLVNRNGASLLAVTLLLQLPSWAQGAVADGLYLGGGVGVSRLNPDTTNTGYTQKGMYDTAGKLYLGYDLNSQLSLEGYYADLGRTRMSPDGSLDYQEVGVNATYYLFAASAQREGLAPFIRGGVGHLMVEGNLPYQLNNDWHFMFGVGLEYGLGNNWALRTDVDLYDRDAQLFTVGVLKRFGGAPAPVVPWVPAPVAEPEPPAPVEEPLPDPDTDGDGVLNEADACPDTVPGTTVDAAGCELQEVIVLKGVVFASGSDELIGDSAEILDAAAITLLRNPERHIEVGGHTDSQGAAGYNKQLSERRSQAVRQYLIGKGVAADHLSARGYGEERPVADNGTEEGRSLNRRVELTVVQPMEAAGE